MADVEQTCTWRIFPQWWFVSMLSSNSTTLCTGRLC